MARPTSISQATILAVAQREFFERGIAAAEMKVIAHKCAIGRSSLYRYFESKESLAFVIAAQVVGQMEEALERGIRQGKTGYTAVERGLRALVGELAAHVDQVRFLVDFDLYFSDGYPDIETASSYENFNRSGSSALQQALERGVRDGSIRPLADTAFTARFLTNTILGVAQRVLPRAAILRREQGYADEYLHQALALLLDSIVAQ